MIHMKQQILEVFLPFILFLYEFDKKNGHNVGFDV
jgi:hypothetical protein